MKRIILFLIVLFFLVSCASSPGNRSGQPGWVDNKFSKYAEANFLVEIGQGSSLKDAKKNGAAALSQIFSTTIKVETNVQTRYKELASGGLVESSEETTFDQDITQLADQELINVNYGESWTNNLGQVYVLAYIDRMVTGNIYRDRIRENSNTVTNFLNRSEEQSSLISKYAYIDASYVVAQANHELLEQLEIISLPLARSMSLPYDLDDLRAKRMDSAKNMAFKINIENDSEGKIVSIIKEELTSLGYSMDSQGSLNISGSLSMEKIELDNKYENVKYYLTINIEDERGVPTVSLESNDRISAISETAAVSRAYLDIEKKIKKELIGKLTDYLDGFVD